MRKETDAVGFKLLPLDFSWRGLSYSTKNVRIFIIPPRFEVDTSRIQVKIDLLEATYWMHNLHVDINVSEEHASRV